MPQNCGYGLAVSSVFQARSGEAVAQSMEIAVLHFTALQDGLEALLDIARLRACVPAS